MREIEVDYEKLSERSDEIDCKEDKELVNEIVLELKRKIREDGLLYLTAPQIGYNSRIFVMNFSGELRTFINPIITSGKSFTLYKEVCYSIPGKEFIKAGNTNIYVTYQTPLGEIESKHMIGVAAQIFTHCVDHLDGILSSDLGLEVGEDFYSATDEERAEVLEQYHKSLEAALSNLRKDISEDDEALEFSEALDFMKAVQRGEVELVQVPVKVEEQEEKENEVSE